MAAVVARLLAAVARLVATVARLVTGEGGAPSARRAADGSGGGREADRRVGILTAPAA